MNDVKTYLLPSTDSESDHTQEYNGCDCYEANPSFNPDLTPADVYPWWNSAEPLRKKKRKKKKHKKQEERELQYLLAAQAIGAAAEREHKKRAQKEQRKQAKKDLQYRLIERSIDATVDTVNAITKMYVSRQLDPYRR